MQDFQKICLLVFFAASMLLLNSCRSLRPSEMFITEEGHEIAEFKPTQKEYKIKPFDKLGLRITTNSGFNLVGLGINNNSPGGNSERQNGLEYLVEFDGQIKLPTIGRVQIAGKTIREAETFLEGVYAEFYKEPFVLIEVTNRKVIIFMDGGTEGVVVTIPSENLTLVEALAQSGGITDFSKSYQIKLIRGDLSGEPEVFMYDFSHLKELQGTNQYLEANDIIYVESKPKYFSRMLDEIVPYVTLLTFALTAYGVFSL